MPRKNFTLLVAALLVSEAIFSQTKTQSDLLKNSAFREAEKERQMQDKLHDLARKKNWPLAMRSKNGGISILHSIDLFGNPVYLATDNNIRAAATIGTTQLWPGGSTGLNLNGSSNNMKGKLIMWDGGNVLSTHVELTGRILNKDAASLSDHSTHVAGTLMAAGVNPLAKGMSFGLQQLITHDFSNHLSEMFLESGNNILVSNHSYGEKAGWVFNDGNNRWEYWGPPGSTEDYKFGYYSNDTQIWDSIAYNAPYYLIVKSAGNNRDENGPAVGSPYYRFDANNQMSPAGNRPSSPAISNNDGYDIISTYGTAKNILTIGAVAPLSAGYSKPSDVSIASFSSWGPTDDGRIKPDVVANGVDLLSCIATANNAYAVYSGTSMATPNAAGSILLLQEYYSKLHSGSFMRSATLKGIVIHTADEAGTTPGPDYTYGWGLIDMVKAASVITDDNTAPRSQRIEENTLNNGATYTTTAVASGKGPLVITLCWTDVKGTVQTGNPLNDRTPKLVNDLDLRVKIGSTVYYPWKLNPNLPSNAATQGDNSIDNVEKIEIPDAVPGQTYTIEITHKNTLARGSQAYSLIMSGVGGTAYCTSGATNSAGSRIDSVSFANLRKQNPASCTTYTNYTNLTADVEANSSVQLFVRVNSCDASNAARAVKAYIDFNNDGDFNDANEQIAASSTLLGNTDLGVQVTIPSGVKVNNYSILRIVLQETSNLANVTPCGAYANGETQDFRIHIVPPSSDAGVVDVVTPTTEYCGNGSQYVTVKIRNFGTLSKSNIPVTATVMNGATTVATLTDTYPGSIAALGEVLFTFSTPFSSVAGTTYTITGKTNLANDQDPTNDQKTVTAAISTGSAAPAGQAEICTNKVYFNATPATGDALFWYDSPTATTPIAAGNVTSSTVITADKKYYLAANKNELGAGPASSTTLGGGGYPTSSSNYLNAYFMTFTTGAPLTIETIRLYVRSATSLSGKITLTVARNITFNANQTSYSYIPVSRTTIDVYPTDATNGGIFYVNLPVPDPGNYGLILTQDASQDMALFFNNNLTTNPYPTGIPGIFNITGNIRSYLTTNDQDKYYFFFYDMKVRLQNCASSRTTVTASTAVAPVITLNNNVFTSNSTTNNQWYVDGNPIAGAIGQTYIATASGTYKVVVSDSYGCSMESNQIPFAVTSVPNVDPAEIGLKVFPNPSDGRFVADFTVSKKADLNISILNAVGQKVFENIYPGFVGRFNKTIEAGMLTGGVYLLRIQHDNKSYLKKLFIR